MNAISTFTFHQDHNVRVQMINGEPYFCLRDICIVLSLDSRSSSKFELDNKGVEKLSTPSNGGNQKIIYVNEPNLYRVIFRSNKPEARQFQDWVFNEVLPTIRKTGQYQVPTQPKAPNYITSDDMNNIKRLVWFCASFFDHEDAFSRATWSSLRHVTNTPSPEQFEVEQLPLLESEFKRLYSIIEPYLNTRRACEKALIKYFIRGRADAALLQQLLDQMHGSVENLHENTNVKFPQLFKIQCTDLIRRKA
ncbi:Bro-N domain-containing protein [Acinetobacter sp. CFCC 10889]|uniref:BRO-N domain-containing protein n=1 Tax=Acinetobacter sp. CFCC 10889 TaxID=1775557 RepID=UPI000DCFB198|nr:BRO family protein [Acinetobacter sp. CFCC 10889]